MHGGGRGRDFFREQAAALGDEARRQALLDRQMAGYFPDGRFARPSPEEINRSIDAV